MSGCGGNRRRRETTLATEEVLRTYGPAYRCVFVGDASVSPYKIIQLGGSVEHWNPEAGRVWMQRLTGHYRRAAWLNPVEQDDWRYVQSVAMVRELMDGLIYPLTIAGLDAMARELGLTKDPSADLLTKPSQAQGLVEVADLGYIGGKFYEFQKLLSILVL